MSITAETIVSTTQSNVAATQALVTKLFTGFEKMVELNMAASKAVMEESFAHAQAGLAAKDAAAFLALQTSAVSPVMGKCVSYSRHVQAIWADVAAEVTQSVEAKAAEGQKAVEGVIDNIAKNAPAGTETAVAALKSAVTTTQNAMDAAKKATKQVVSMAEANATAITDKVLATATATAVPAKA